MALFTPILKYVWKENAKLDAARIRLQTPTAGVDCVCNIPYINDKTAEHMLDVYFPENSNERLPVIIDIHGGGWMSGSKEINKNFCTNIAVKGFCVFSINYRLAGKHKFNEQIEDILKPLIGLRKMPAHTPPIWKMPFWQAIPREGTMPAPQRLFHLRLYCKRILQWRNRKSNSRPWRQFRRQLI